MMRPSIAFLALATAAAPPPPARDAAGPPAASALWTLSSNDCVSVDADGEPWQECGFQAFDINEGASRVLTVSSTGVVQLWDAAGREIKRIEWQDEPSGASGYPDGRALIVGKVGVAVVHQNQLILLDLTDGRILAQRVTDVMTIQELRRVGPDRVFTDIRDRDWGMGAREILLTTGEMRPVAGLTDLMRLGPSYWMTGARSPFTLYRAGGDPAGLASDRSCMPVDARYCAWRDIPGSAIHVLDVAQGRWQSFDLGRTLTMFDSAEVVDAAGRLYLLTCGRSAPSYPSRRPCSVVDLATRKEIYAFEASNVRAVGASDEQGRPEIRLAVGTEPNKREDRRVSQDGAVRIVDVKGGSNLSAPGGGMIVPGEGAPAGILLDATGHRIARLPFRPLSCGNGWPTWMGFCRVSADGRRWLVPRDVLPESSPDHKTGLTLYELPALPR